MNILLIYPPIREIDVPRHFPTGLGIIAQVLRNKGHKINVLDINGNRWSPAEVAEKIKKQEFDLVGIGGLVTVYRYVKWLIPILKKRNPTAKIIVGGSLGSSIPELILQKAGADIAVIGEGEQTVIELIDALEAGSELHSVNGICFKENDEVISTPPRQLITDIDAVPFPAWALFPMEIYLKNPIVGFGRDMNVISSRGCPFHCVYCYQLFGRKYRFRSVDSIIEEIRLLKDKYRIDFVSFQDDCFVVNRQRVYDFCDELEKQKIRIRWSCTGRVNIITEDLLKRMKTAGCTSVSYGIESGSQTILDEYKKGVTVEQAKRAIRATRKVGLRCPTSFMLGAIGETRETTRETAEFCKELNIPLSTICFTTSYPGTPLFEEAKEKGILKFRDIDDLDKFVEDLGDVTKLNVNLTTFSDAQLLRLRDELLEDIAKNCTKPNILGKALEYCKLFGVRGFSKLLLQRVRLGKKVYLAAEEPGSECSANEENVPQG